MGTVKPFAAEVATDSSGAFYGNAMRFPTKDAAVAYVQDLFYRWTSVRSWRVVEYVHAGWATIKTVVQVKE